MRANMKIFNKSPLGDLEAKKKYGLEKYKKTVKHNEKSRY
jgi:hypothetical protein